MDSWRLNYGYSHNREENHPERSYKTELKRLRIAIKKPAFCINIDPEFLIGNSTFRHRKLNI